MNVKTVFCLLALLLITTSMAGAQGLIVNGGFEADGAVGWNGTPTGWAVGACSHISLGTSTDNPRTGSYCWNLSKLYAGSTTPVITQVFTSASAFKVEGWVRTSVAYPGAAVVRIRENKKGVAGTVKYFNGICWTANTQEILEPGGFGWGDAPALAANNTVVVSDTGTWTKFSFVIPALTGVSEYAIDLGATVNTTPFDGTNINSVAYFDDIAITPVFDAPPANNILVNPGFEADASGVGMAVPPSGWTQAGYSHVNTGTTIVNPHAGSFAYSQCRYYTGSTFPVIYQTFNTSGNFNVEGYCRTVEHRATVRIRENKLGPAGTVRYWDANQKAWVYNTVPFAEPGGFYQSDVFGMGTNFSTFTADSRDWAKFAFSVSALPGVSDYAIDLCSPYYASGGTNETYYSYWDDIAVSPVDLTVPAGLRRPFVIEQSDSITVDGDLSDWNGTEWVPLDVNYDGAPSDIQKAYYAAKWGDNGNKVYVAVKVKDTSHFFTNSYVDWNSRDGVELYLHTTNNGPADYPSEAEAQMYAIGLKASNHSEVWSNFTNLAIYTANPVTRAVDVPANAGLQAAGYEDGDWLYYEVAMTPYHYYGGLLSSPSIVSTLQSGYTIGLDVVVTGRNNTPAATGTYTGMVAENLINGGGKSFDWKRFGKHLVATGLMSTAAKNIGSAKSTSEGTPVFINDAVVSAAFYGDSATDYPGVGFAIENSTRESGIRVLWGWNDADVTTIILPGDVVSIAGTAKTIAGERVIAASSVIVSAHGAPVPAPLGMNNAASAGGAFGGQPAITNDATTNALSTGANNVGLLMTIWGTVTKTSSPGPATFDEYFYVNDGSGLSDGSGFVGIRCRPSGSSYGPDYMPEEGEYVSVTGVMGVMNIDGKPVRCFWTVSVN